MFFFAKKSFPRKPRSRVYFLDYEYPVAARQKAGKGKYHMDYMQCSAHYTGYNAVTLDFPVVNKSFQS